MTTMKAAVVPELAAGWKSGSFPYPSLVRAVLAGRVPARVVFSF
jgi:hypothetical protein